MRYRIKPELVEAVQRKENNLEELKMFSGMDLEYLDVGDWVIKKPSGELLFCSDKMLNKVYEVVI